MTQGRLWVSDPSSPWTPVSKAHPGVREMADRHYTRQTPGHPMWTRPGYNYVLLSIEPEGRALFCWWRPKWESGNPFTCRKDGLRVIECTMFRREGVTKLRSSDYIRAAVAALAWPEADSALRLRSAGQIDGLITGVGSKATERLRSRRSLPGACYRHAGWTVLDKPGGKADVWLEHPYALTAHPPSV